jgi:Flp pilus assembly protein TadG
MTARAPGPLLRRLGSRAQESGDRDRGTALVEFTFLGVLVMVPLVYLVVAVASVQRSSAAVGEAARAAGRAMAQADTVQQGRDRAQAAVRIVFEDQGLPPATVSIRIVAPESDCDAAEVAPSLEPGAEYAVCVLRQAEIPGVPTVLTGRGVQTVGRYVVHVDDFRR